MDIVSYALHFNQHHSILIAIATLVAMFPIAFLKKRFYLAAFIMLFGLLNFGFNSDLNRWYVHQHGARGTGSITEARPSNVVINKRPQTEFDVLLKVKDGQIIKSSFNSYDEIFINESEEGPAEYSIPPEIGEEFTILYMPGDLKNFAIVVDDYKSAYGRRLHCSQKTNPEIDCP